jgi:hypothetical protein
LTFLEDQTLRMLNSPTTLSLDKFSPKFWHTGQIMAVAGVFNIHPDNLRLGAVRARGSPGVTLYEADLQLGSRWTKVCLARQQEFEIAVCKQ